MAAQSIKKSRSDIVNIDDEKLIAGIDFLKIDGRDHISVNEARELRLRYGKRLRRDVNHLLQE